MTELTPERLAYRESWRDKIRGYIASKVLQVAELIDDSLFEETEDDD